MASARPSSFKTGGGFLKGVTGLIASYIFTTDFNGKPGARTKEGFLALQAKLTAKVDGADKAQDTSLFVGDADQWTISDDGKTITAKNDSVGIPGNKGWGLFISTLVEKGFPETRLPEDVVNYEAIQGTRVTFDQRVNEDANKRFGKRAAKVGKGSFDRTDLVVSAVVALPAEGGVAAPAATTKSGKKTAVVTPVEAVDLVTLADETLGAIAKAKGGTVARKNVSIEVTKKLMKHPHRDAVRDLIYSEAYLKGAEERGLLVFDEEAQNVVWAS